MQINDLKKLIKEAVEERKKEIPLAQTKIDTSKSKTSKTE